MHSDRKGTFRQSRASAMEELQEETRRVYEERRSGKLTLEEAEGQLESLARRYETPFDRLLYAE